MFSASVKKELLGILGRDNLSFLREDILCYSYDATNKIVPPEAVAFPATAEEISSILKIASLNGFPVIARGAGTGFTGGALPVDGGLILSTERMKKIIEIDTENLTAEVEPGVITGDLQAEVEKLGLFYPPDPTSFKFSTIGGNIAECAGGPRAVKYGVTRDYVLGLEVVLPTGEIIKTGGKTLKGVVGYDLTRLIVGSEGTLGVVTKAWLRLIAQPEARKMMLVKFAALEDAARTVISIIRNCIVPSTLELIDNASLRCVEEFTRMGLGGVEAVLLIEVDGRRESIEKDVLDIEAICKENSATEFRAATDKFEVRDLWKVRRSISPALKRLKSLKLNEDVVVPRSKLVELIKGVERISKDRGVIIASFGHAGDGNIHVNIMVDKDDAEDVAKGKEAVKDVFRLTVSLGGTISGEHGVGTTKMPYIDMELGSAAIEAMKRVKDALDPRGILNPGKIFPAQG